VFSHPILEFGVSGGFAASFLTRASSRYISGRFQRWLRLLAGVFAINELARTANMSHAFTVCLTTADAISTAMGGEE
jgi:hypothetical protein